MADALEPEVRVLCGDMREVLRTLPAESVHAVVTDPPYGLEFMGKQWDQQVPGPDYWREVLRVLKPGGHVLAFGGTRTAHRLACAIEDAGFELRDCLSWLYGSGFPKSHNLDGAWDGWGTATKPAWEPVYLAVKPVTWEHVDAQLYALKEALWSRLNARLAAQLLESNPRDCDEEAFASAPWSVADACSTPDVSCVPTDTSPSEWATLSSWSTVCSWRRILAASSQLESTSTTSTETRPTTDWTTLHSCLSRITPASMLQSHGLGSSAGASPALVLLSALVAGSHATLIRFAVEPAFTSGAPNSLGVDVPQQFTPNYRPIYLARKPFRGSVASNVGEHGCGALNIDGCRIGTEPAFVGVRCSKRNNGIMNAVEGFRITSGGNGRWPANLVLDEEAARLLDAQTGELSSHATTGVWDNGRRESATTIAAGQTRHWVPGFCDKGGASRFFYVAKSSRSEREAGLERFEPHIVNDGRDTPIDNPYQRGNTLRKCTHPTVKPIALMRWLVRLITPPGGLVLDPFTGSGSTGVAAVLEGARFIGCELSPEYAQLARARIAHAADEDDDQLALFERSELKAPVKVQPSQASFLWGEEMTRD